MKTTTKPKTKKPAVKFKGVVVEDSHMLIKNKRVEQSGSCRFLQNVDIYTAEHWENSLEARGIPYVLVDEGGKKKTTDRYSMYVEASTLTAYNRINEPIPAGDQNEQYKLYI